MITASHAIIYAEDPESARSFLRDVLELPFVDVHDGWLIFKLPPAEAAVHPAEGESGVELYLMCDDLQAVIESLAAKHVACTAVERARWGLKTAIRLPGGGHLGLYQPTHPTALDL